MTDAPPVDPRSHKWWLTARTGEHGPDCTECRRSPAGPDHTGITTVVNLKGHIREWGARLEHAPPGVVYVGRRFTMGGWDLPGHPLRNPFTTRECGSVEEAVRRYNEHLSARPDLLALIPALRGKRLACWCKPGPCHADIIAELADHTERTAR